MASEKQLDQQARDFMTFPPPRINNGQKTHEDNFGRPQECRREVREDHGCN